MLFEINPTDANAGTYTVYVDLVDNNNLDPMSSRYEFDLQVIDSSKLNFW